MNPKKIWNVARCHVKMMMNYMKNLILDHVMQLKSGTFLVLAFIYYYQKLIFIKVLWRD